MKPLRLTSRYRFSASHRLHAPALSDEENRKLYGKCNNPYGHGHDYVLDLTLEGALDASGQVVNRMALDALVKEMVLARLDHKDLNSDVPEFELIPPTSENLAALIRSWLERHWTLAARLVRVQIAETGKNRFVWERTARGALAK